MWNAFVLLHIVIYRFLVGALCACVCCRLLFWCTTICMFLNEHECVVCMGVLWARGRMNGMQRMQISVRLSCKTRTVLSAGHFVYLADHLPICSLFCARSQFNEFRICTNTQTSMNFGCLFACFLVCLFARTHARTHAWMHECICTYTYSCTRTRSAARSFQLCS